MWAPCMPLFVPENTNIVRLFSVIPFLVNCKVGLLKTLNSNIYHITHTGLFHQLELPINMKTNQCSI